MTQSNDIQLTSTRLDIQMMPGNFSRAYMMYNLQQAQNLEKLAGKTHALTEDAQAIQDTLNTLERSIKALERNTVTKNTTALQTLHSVLSAPGFAVDGVPVLGARVNGITLATGTAHLGVFNADENHSAGLKEARQRIKALEDVMRAHGLMG